MCDCVIISFALIVFIVSICITNLVNMSQNLEAEFEEVRRLNLTATVQHLLDGESDIIADDENVPSPINPENIMNTESAD